MPGTVTPIHDVDRQQDEITVEFDTEMTNDEFHHEVLPYAIGYMSATHGLTNVDFSEKKLMFTRRYDKQ